MFTDDQVDHLVMVLRGGFEGLAGVVDSEMFKLRIDLCHTVEQAIKEALTPPPPTDEGE